MAVVSRTVLYHRVPTKLLQSRPLACLTSSCTGCHPLVWNTRSCFGVWKRSFSWQVKITERRRQSQMRYIKSGIENKVTLTLSEDKKHWRHCSLNVDFYKMKAHSYNFSTFRLQNLENKRKALLISSSPSSLPMALIGNTVRRQW